MWTLTEHCGSTSDRAMGSYPSYFLDEVGFWCRIFGGTGKLS